MCAVNAGQKELLIRERHELHFPARQDRRFWLGLGARYLARVRAVLGAVMRSQLPCQLSGSVMTHRQRVMALLALGLGYACAAVAAPGRAFTGPAEKDQGILSE